MSSNTWMIDRAKEELNILESRHPSRFDYLKLELQSLISDHDLNPSSSAGTQVSSNRKRRGGEFCGEKKRKMRLSSEDRADLAIERAKACLRRIQIVKQSFLH